MTTPAPDSQTRAFLAAIGEDGGDDTSRLVFADWLTEQDDPQGEFIRRQCELARMDEGDPAWPRTLAASRRCGFLTAPRGRPWVDYLPAGAAMFRRGLIAGARVGADDYLRHPGEAWALVPLEQLRLDRPGREQGARPRGEELARRAELARLPSAVFTRYWYPSELMAALTGPTALAGLRALRIFDVNAPIADVVQRLDLPALDSLSLDIGTHPPRNWDAFLPASGPPLRRLVLEGRAEDNGEWEWPYPTSSWLRGTRHGDSLREATLLIDVDHISSGSYLVPAPLSRTREGFLPRKEKIRMYNLSIRASQIDALCERKDWGNLRSLALMDYYDFGHLSRLYECPQADQLRWLRIHGNDPRVEIDSPRYPSPALAGLRRLTATHADANLLAGDWAGRLLRAELQPLAYTSGAELVAGASLSSLRHLTLCDRHAARGLTEWAGAWACPNLCTLVLPAIDDCPSVPAALASLARAGGMPHLSLVGVGRRHERRWWVLGGGEARPVAPGIDPLDEDWWEGEPLDEW